jgi:hypothetical protein
VAVVHEGSGVAVERVDASVTGSHPEHPVRVLVEGPHPIVTEALRIARIVGIVRERPGRVELVEPPSFRADPEIPMRILEDGRDVVS